MPDQMFSTSDLALYIGRPIQTCGLIVLPSVCGIFTLGGEDRLHLGRAIQTCGLIVLPSVCTIFAPVFDAAASWRHSD